jgi:hypothetical protein
LIGSGHFGSARHVLVVASTAQQGSLLESGGMVLMRMGQHDSSRMQPAEPILAAVDEEASVPVRHHEN